MSSATAAAAAAAGTLLDVKKSSHKKMSKFLQVGLQSGGHKDSDCWHCVSMPASTPCMYAFH
jgi:hypothetical protein